MDVKVEEGIERLIHRHFLRTPSTRVVRVLLAYEEEILSWDHQYAGEYLLRLESMLESFIEQNRKSSVSKCVAKFLDSEVFERKMRKEIKKAKENGWIFKEAV